MRIEVEETGAEWLRVNGWTISKVRVKEIGLPHSPGVYDLPPARKVTMVKRAKAIHSHWPGSAEDLWCPVCGHTVTEGEKCRRPTCDVIIQEEVPWSEIAAGTAGPLVTEEEEPVALPGECEMAEAMAAVYMDRKSAGLLLADRMRRVLAMMREKGWLRE